MALESCYLPALNLDTLYLASIHTHKLHPSSIFSLSTLVQLLKWFSNTPVWTVINQVQSGWYWVCFVWEGMNQSQCSSLWENFVHACNQFIISSCVMGCISVELSSHWRGRNVRFQGRISCWSDPSLQMQAIPSYVSMLQPGWQLLRGFTLQLLHCKATRVCWALTQTKLPKTHIREATHPWVNWAGSSDVFSGCQALSLGLHLAVVSHW